MFIAWDEDNAFLASDFAVTTRLDENILTRRTLETGDYRSQYFAVLGAAADSASGWMRQEMQRQFDMIHEAMLADTQKPYTNAQYAAERDRLLAFPDARITYVRCEIARELRVALPSNCP